jgi:hypothetical protein
MLLEQLLKAPGKEKLTISMNERLREDLEKCRFTETRFQNLLAVCKADSKGPRTLNGVIRFYILLQRDLKRQLDEQLGEPRWGREPGSQCR